MRLCFVIENDTDVRLVEGLDESFDLTVIGRAQNGGVKISQPPARTLRTISGPAGRLQYFFFVLQTLLTRSNDFVLVQGYGLTAMAANLAARLTGTPTAMLVCSPAEAYYQCRKNAPTSHKPYRAHEVMAIRLVAQLNGWIGRRYIVLSDYLGDVVRQYGTKNRIHHIPLYGVDTEHFTPPESDKRTLKRQLNLPPEGTLIFFSSRIAPEKDSETLLAAFKRLRQGGRDLWLLHRSGGYKQFQEVANEYGVGNRVVATDAVHPHQALPDSYRASDLCIQSSRAEGLGFSPLEALACKVPVIASSVGGLRETIRNGETGWTYPVGDARALAACIEQAIDNPDEATRRAQNGYEMIHQSYARKHVFQQLQQLVFDLTNQRAAAPSHQG